MFLRAERMGENKDMRQADLIHVKFILEPNETFGSAFKKYTTIGEIREQLSDILEVDTNILKLHDERLGTLADTVTLNQIVDDLITISSYKLQLRYNEGASAIIEEKVRENIPSLDVITIHVCKVDGYSYEDVTVAIENQVCQKEWLGGFHHKLTGLVYHNAYTQTKPKRKIYDGSAPLLFHRDTQTPHDLKEASMSTVTSHSTQMRQHDLYVESRTDRILTARPYQPYMRGRTVSDVDRMAVVIQNALRSWLSRKKIVKLVEVELQHIKGKKTIRNDINALQKLKEQFIITSAVYPSKREDFYFLYLLIEKWMKKEMEHIKRMQDDVTKKACNYMLLMKEITFLSEIEKHKITVKKESLKKLETRFLQLTSRPKTFKNTKGQITSIDDLETQHARQLREMYSELINRNRTVESRVQFLLVFKEQFTSKYETYEYAEDIKSLVAREVQLITVGTRSKDLKGLRARIEQLYLHFIHQEEFNPKVKYYKKANWPKTIEALYQCNRCGKLLPPSKFPVHVIMKSYSQCTSCQWIQNTSHNRVDMSPFLKLLRQVQRKEMEMCCHSSVCFVLQKIGMAYLTNIIWHGQSALSACKMLTRLRHVRWLEEVEWAPWNTILLTDGEARLHQTLDDVFSFYNPKFIETVRQRHFAARNHFQDLLKMDHYLRSTGAWHTINDSGPYFHPSHADSFATENDFDKF